MKYGLYEQIINLKIKENISIISDRYKQIESIDKAEASKVLSVYVGDVVRKALDDIGNDKIEDKINLVNKIVHTIQNERQEAYYNKLTIDEAELLYALLADKDPRASATDSKLSNLLHVLVFLARSYRNDNLRRFWRTGRPAIRKQIVSVCLILTGIIRPPCFFNELGTRKERGTCKASRHSFSKISG